MKAEPHIILVTGGCGYIGSHVVVELIQNNYQVIVIDNLLNSFANVLDSIEKITDKLPIFYEGDIRNSQLLTHVFDSHPIDAVIHLAGLKSIDESVQQPLHYFENNIIGALTLIKTMANHKVKNLIFSSSAAVYGAQGAPFNEFSSEIKPNNPYARSKFIIEELLNDICHADVNWSVGVLRYFNPVGAHESGLIGEMPKIKAKNLFPNICQVVMGNQEILNVFGDDYPTSDGTAIRDYIHVVDLAVAHLKSLQALQNRKGIHIWNIGTGRGYSIKEVILTFEATLKRIIRYKIQPRRPGDVAVCFADFNKAKSELDWVPDRDLNKMVADALAWKLTYLHKINTKELDTIF